MYSVLNKLSEIYNFTYQKALLHALLLLLLKSSKAFSLSLIPVRFYTHDIYKTFDCNPTFNERVTFLDISKTFD